MTEEARVLLLPAEPKLSAGQSSPSLPACCERTITFQFIGLLEKSQFTPPLTKRLKDCRNALGTADPAGISDIIIFLFKAQQ